MSEVDTLDPELREILENSNYQDLKLTLEEFEALHDHRQDLKDRLKAVDEQYDVMRKIIVLESMKHNGILGADGHGSCTTPSGRKVYVTTDTRAYIRKEDEPEAHAAIREMGFGELIRETVHPSTLTAWIRQRLEEGASTPPGVQMYQQEKAVLRKS